MLEVLIFLVKSLLISILLYALYVALFRGKASYKAQRIMLLSIPIMAIVAPLISFDLIKIETDELSSSEVYMQRIDAASYARSNLERTQPSNYSTLFNTAGDESLESVPANDEQLARAQSQRSSDLLPFMNDAALVVWVLSSIVLIVLFAVRLRKILHLRYLANSEEREDYTIYRFDSDNILFSFWRGIYMSQSIKGDKFDMVLCHEAGHIRHRHYIDKMIAEIYVIILWFNPVVRIIQRELSLIHEYEADHEVVKSSSDITAYMHFIFEEATTPVPTFANGLNSSQIKKRFITMKKNYTVSHRGLRVLMTAVAFLIISISTMISVQAKEPQRIDERRTHKTMEVKDDMMIVTKIDSVGSEQVSINVFTQKLDKNSNIYKNLQGRTGIIPFEVAESLVDDPRVKPESFDERITFKPGDYKVVQYHDPRKNMGMYHIYVVRHKDYTQVDFVTNVNWEWHWYKLSSRSYLLDKKTGDKYMHYETLVNVPIDRAIWFKGLNGKTVVLTAIYPPLAKDVKFVDYMGNTKHIYSPTYNYSATRSPYMDNIRVLDSVDELPYSVVVPESEGRVIEMDEDFKLPKK